MNIIDWDHVEWATGVDKTRDIQPRDFEDYKRMACVAMSLRAEITQLRAELAAERELVDRLYSAIEYIDDYCLAYPELEAVSAVSSSAIDYVDTRRNK